MRKLLFFTASMLSSVIYAQDSIEVKLNKANCNFNQGVTQLQQKGWTISEFYNANNNTLFISNPAIKSLLNVQIDTDSIINTIDSNAESIFIASQLTCFTYERIELDPMQSLDVSASQGAYYTKVQSMRAEVGISEANRYTTAQNTFQPVNVVLMDNTPIYKSYNYTNLQDVVVSPLIDPYNGLPRISPQYHGSIMAETLNSVGQFRIHNSGSEFDSATKDMTLFQNVWTNDSAADTNTNNCSSSGCMRIFGSPMTWADRLPSSGGVTLQQKYVDLLYELAKNSVVIASTGNVHGSSSSERTQMFRQHYHRKGVIFVSESVFSPTTGNFACLSPATPADSFDPDQTPIVDMTVAVSGGFPISGTTGLHGSSPSTVVVTGAAATIKGFNYHMNHEQITTSLINSTKIFNNRKTKDVCTGYGRFNHDAAMKYAKDNFPKRTWTPLWAAWFTGNNWLATTDYAHAMSESCVNSGGYVISSWPAGTNPQYRKCSPTPTYTGADKDVTIYYDLHFVGSEFKNMYSAYSDGIPKY